MVENLLKVFWCYQFTSVLDEFSVQWLKIFTAWSSAMFHYINQKSLARHTLATLPMFYSCQKIIGKFHLNRKWNCFFVFEFQVRRCYNLLTLAGRKLHHRKDTKLSRRCIIINLNYIRSSLTMAPISWMESWYFWFFLNFETCELSFHNFFLRHIYGTQFRKETVFIIFVK